MPLIVTSPPNATTESVTRPLTRMSPPKTTTDGTVVPLRTTTSSPNCTSDPRCSTIAPGLAGDGLADLVGDALAVFVAGDLGDVVAAIGRPGDRQAEHDHEGGKDGQRKRWPD